ncbi:hypothetical protein [Streptosporangium pseudovulgare]|uniref:Uncharacterized protein n=1 Tax=Streptosporangium pseudovulgare TaxID=35765 RepID=A0ABQ2QUW2_9ACTN|nr:hypothetical protein [Streptosporangium pseudovulgare]GGP98881.1 hypothetical protein GCM10010140_31080 [Streptosporangium pseudovulgare]
MSINDELHEVEEEIARLRSEAADLREQVNDLGPTDAVERSALITMAEQQESLADDLEVRREGLNRKLGEAGQGESRGS